jgi:hypothetical protein
MTVVTYDQQLEVDSSAFETAFFNRDDRRLYVKFWNGSTVCYSNFTVMDWEQFSNSRSKGAYYNGKIKSNWNHPGSFVDAPVSFQGRQLENLNVMASNESKDSKTGDVNITINIYVSGDPEDIAKAVERVAPSIRAINQLGSK